jgi:hypothetical protein
MAELTTFFKFLASLGTKSSETSQVMQNPDPIALEFQVGKRSDLERIDLIGGGSATFALDARFDDISFFRIECMNKGKTFTIALNGSNVAIPIAPPSASQKAFILGTIGITTITVENPDTVNPISLGMSIFQKAS